MRTLILLLIMATLGCAGSESQIVGDGYQIEEVVFEGTSRFSDGFILSYIHAGETTWIPFTPDYSHDRGLLLADARRIEALYRAHGFYEASVTNFETKRNDEDKTAVVKFTVFEGRPTTIDQIHFKWTERNAEIAAEIEGLIDSKRGGTFELGTFNQSQGKIRQGLLKHGYPKATVRGNADVDRKLRRADVTFEIAPGPAAIIGKVRIEGLVYVPNYLVQNEIDFAIGEPYSPQRVKQMVGAVKSMRVFRWVAAQPVTTVTDGQIELLIQVSEADPHSIKLGGELEIDTVRWQEQARLGYTNTNLFGHLTKLSLAATAGFAQIPNPFNPDLSGPILKIRPKFSKKGLVEKHLAWSITPQFKVDLQEGYKYFDVGERFAVSRWFLGRLRLEVNHLIRYVNFYEVSDTLGANESLLGRDFRDPYLLSQLGTRAQIFFVNSITKPKNGGILEAMYAISAKQIASDYGYHKSKIKGRAYWTLTDWLMLASVAEAGIIVPFGTRAGAPFDRKFYLGGANTVRGWGSRRLSPQIEECDPETGECDTVPVGGYTMLRGNFELRYNVFGPVFMVGFFDMGDVQATELTYQVDEWNYSAGPGLRVQTPLGRARLDVGFRLNDPGVFPDEPAWALYFGFGEAI